MAKTIDTLNQKRDFHLRDKVNKNLPVSVLYRGSVIDPWGLALGEDVSIHAVIQAQVDGASTSFSSHMVPSTKGIVERDQLKKGSIKKLSTSTDPADYKAK